MIEFKYEPVRRINKEELARDLLSSDPAAVSKALYSACRSDEDTGWIENECVIRLKDQRLQVRWAAATCLGDLAFFRRPIDAARVSQALEEAAADPSISDPASLSLSMVKEFFTT
jgi:hypothetical protein